MIELLRPCGVEFLDGKQFGEWGPLWGYHFDEKGAWVKGKVDHLGVLSGNHGGHDIKCQVGTPLLCPGEGLVLEAGWQDPQDPKRGYGKRVLLSLDEPKGWLLTLGHFSEIIAVKGNRVRRGELLGFSGETGNTHGAHVHVQLEKPGPYPRMPFNFKWSIV